jgi:hypothetical protein
MPQQPWELKYCCGREVFLTFAYRVLPPPVEMLLPSNDSSLMMSTPDPTTNFDASAYLADVDEQDWPDALDFFAVTAHKC